MKYARGGMGLSPINQSRDDIYSKIAQFKLDNRQTVELQILNCLSHSVWLERISTSLAVHCQSYDNQIPWTPKFPLKVLQNNKKLEKLHGRKVSKILTRCAICINDK